jgi:hypothetical protein
MSEVIENPSKNDLEDGKCYWVQDSNGKERGALTWNGNSGFFKRGLDNSIHYSAVWRIKQAGPNFPENAPHQ